MRTRPRPKHSMSYLDKYRSDKLERMINAGKKLLEKFYRITNNKFIIIKVKHGGYDYAKNKDIEKIFLIANFDGNLKYFHQVSKSWIPLKIDTLDPPYHMCVDFRKENSTHIYRVNLENLFSKSNTDWNIYYFDDEYSSKLYLEMLENGDVQ